MSAQLQRPLESNNHASSSDPLIINFLATLRDHQARTTQDDPNYYAQNPDELCATCVPLSFALGTGEALLADILTRCLSARHEVLVVTCFWAKSASQRLVATFLRRLSARACADRRTVRVRIGFSSLSLLQKLFHTGSLDGHVYDASTWDRFGLPSPAELPGVELRVKSIFIRPFSVMHSKFIVVDRVKAFLPSCNVSFEEWFEGCLEVEGEFVGNLVKFWKLFWGRDEAFPEIGTIGDGDSVVNSLDLPAPVTGMTSESRLLSRITFPDQGPVQAILLPSPHHANPAFRPLPFTTAVPPPPTPLNLFLSNILSAAQESIFIQSPNFTSSPVISSLQAAFKRGVDVQLVTSSLLMIIEQLVTAGTITEFCFWLLKRAYGKFLAEQTAKERAIPTDIEARAGAEGDEHQPGKLSISYYSPRSPRQDSIRNLAHEPQKSHFKLVIVDDRVVVLGSGNQDRASWYTSQELGFAIFSVEIAGKIKSAVNDALKGRMDGKIGGAQ